MMAQAQTASSEFFQMAGIVFNVNCDNALCHYGSFATPHTSLNHFSA